MKPSLPFVMRLGRALLWLITACMVVLCMWHVKRYAALGASWGLVCAVFFGLVGSVMLWAGLSSRQQITSGVVTIAAAYRDDGAACAYEYSQAYARQRLTMCEVELTGAVLWAVDTGEAVITSSHGRAGLATWGYLPGEAVDQPLSEFNIDAWDQVLDQLRFEPSQPVVVVGEDHVSAYANSSSADERVVVTTINTSKALVVGSPNG